MDESRCDIGVIGLGVMGRNLALNIADHGFAAAGYDREAEQTAALRAAAGDGRIDAAGTLGECVRRLRAPRTLLMLVPAGDAVDSVIRELAPMLAPGDIIIDGGNSHFRDTDRRGKHLAVRGIHYLGCGISGGEHGARYGPSIMPGGPQQAYAHVHPILEAVAARADDGIPCVTRLGPGSAGHYVKMVHNGVEYALMQLIAETYDLMHRGLGLSDDELRNVYDRWNTTEVRGYLVEITSRIFRQPDDAGGGWLIDAIRDEARQKGTGRWTSQDAMDLGVPVPLIDTAVAMRGLSDLAGLRAAAARRYGRTRPIAAEPRDDFVDHLHDAFHAAMIIAYAQGLALLRSASRARGYDLDLEAVTRVWRGGCIIRTALLDDIRRAFLAAADLPHLLLDEALAARVATAAGSLRTVVQAAAASGIPAPAFMSALGYLDALRSPRLPANLIQAQRDLFGDHTYERLDAVGTFHTEWSHA